MLWVMLGTALSTPWLPLVAGWPIGWDGPKSRGREMSEGATAGAQGLYLGP